MKTLNLQIENVGQAFTDIASLSMDTCNPSAILSRLGRVMTINGEPTIGAMLQTMSTLMLRAEEEGHTIALNAEHFAYTGYVNYDEAKRLADGGFCTLPPRRA